MDVYVNGNCNLFFCRFMHLLSGEECTAEKQFWIELGMRFKDSNYGQNVRFVSTRNISFFWKRSDQIRILLVMNKGIVKNEPNLLFTSFFFF